MKKPVALALIALTLVAQPARAEDWIGARIWHKFETLIHPKKKQAPKPQAPPEKTGPLSDAETAQTSSAQFIRALANSPRYKQILAQDSRLMTLLKNDPTLALEQQQGEYRAHVVSGPSLAFLLGEDSGVNEGYSVAQHTVRVLEVYQDQKKFYGLKNPRSEIRNIDSLLKFTLAFHDIGKSFAARAGDKSHETIYSCPIALVLMRAAGFNAQENRLSNALIWSHQILGNFVRDRVAPDTVKNIDDPEQAAIVAIRAAVKYAQIDKHEFFKLMTLVMTADAASYPTLRDGVFTLDQNGQLISNSAAKLADLESKI